MASGFICFCVKLFSLPTSFSLDVEILSFEKLYTFFSFTAKKSVDCFVIESTLFVPASLCGVEFFRFPLPNSSGEFEHSRFPLLLPFGVFKVFSSWGCVFESVLIFLSAADNFWEIRKDCLEFTFLSLSNPFGEFGSFRFLLPISIGESVSTVEIKSFCFLLPFSLNNSVILFLLLSRPSRCFKSSLIWTGSSDLVPVTDVSFSAEDDSSFCSLTSEKQRPSSCILLDSFNEPFCAPPLLSVLNKLDKLPLSPLVLWFIKCFKVSCTTSSVKWSSLKLFAPQTLPCNK